jgi:hypothetical protein
MSLLICPSCDRVNDPALVSHHIAESLGIGRHTVYHCGGCGDHFRDQLVAGISVVKKGLQNAEVQNQG